MPSHRRVDLLRRCLTSLQHQADEIVVVDDGSPGGCVSALVRREFPACTLVRHESPRGFCVAANAGVEAARFPVVALVNDDAEALPGWSRAVAAFADPAVGAAASLVLRPDGRIDSAGDGYDPGGFAFKRGHGERPAGDWLVERDVFGASGSSLFVRRDLFRALGGFPESFGAYFEDVDLAHRLRAAGYRVRYCPASRAVHAGGASHGPPRGDLLRQQSRNEERVWLRHHGRRHLPRHGAVLALKAARRLREGTFGPWLAGRLAAWAER